MSHGLVEPLQEDDERIVGLFLRLCSDLCGQCQGSQADQPPLIAVFRLTFWSVNDTRSTTASLRIDSPLRLEQGSYRGEERGLGVAEAGSYLRGDVARLTPLTHATLPRSYQMRQGSGR